MYNLLFYLSHFCFYICLWATSDGVQWLSLDLCLGSPLMGLWKPYDMPKTEHRLATCKARCYLLYYYSVPFSYAYSICKDYRNPTLEFSNSHWEIFCQCNIYEQRNLHIYTCMTYLYIHDRYMFTKIIHV